MKTPETFLTQSSLCSEIRPTFFWLLLLLNHLPPAVLRFTAQCLLQAYSLTHALLLLLHTIVVLPDHL